MAQTLLIEYDKTGVDINLITKDPEAALKIIISQQTSSQISNDFLHTLIRTVMPRNDNNLKRLLYYYFETIKDEKSFMVCMNQINKDLQSPNEYVRGHVLRFISRMDNLDQAMLVLRGVKENLTNKNAYVRMNAVNCLCSIACRFEMDVEGEMEVLRREGCSEVLRVAFGWMNRLGLSVDDYLKNEYSSEVKLELIKIVDDKEFLNRCLQSKSEAVVYAASCKLLIECNNLDSENSMNNETMKWESDNVNIDSNMNINKIECTENCLRILQKESIKYDFIPFLKFIEFNALKILNLIDSNDLQFAESAIKQAFSNAETHEFVKVAEMLFEKYTECNSTSQIRKNYKVLLLNSMALFADSHCVFDRAVVNVCLKNMDDDCCEIVYSSLNLLKSVLNCDNNNNCENNIKNNNNNNCENNNNNNNKIINYVIDTVDYLIKNFSKIKQGKIFRLAFDIISLNIIKSQYNTLLDTLLADLSDSCNYLNSDIFLGTHICLCISFMHNPIWNLKEKTLGTLLKFIEYGTKHNTLDLSSKATITLCVRSVINNIKHSRSDPNVILTESGSVLDPIQFKANLKQKEYEWESPIDSKTNTVQLSGLGDPLYIEANIIYNKYEITLDILIINQTELFLQDISFDFTSSKYLSYRNNIQGLSLQPNTASTIQIQFTIKESANCFITATVCFKYPKHGEYCAKPFILNLSEIKLEIKEFLEPAKVDFKEEWKDLEWENIYSISMAKTDPKVILASVLEAINGGLCDQQIGPNFLVANVACYTILKTLILINFCFSLNENTGVEIRVRSSDEEVVKSISNLLSLCMKRIKVV